MFDCKPFLAASALFACAACSTASADRYPSLAIRDIERVEGTFEPVPTQQLDVPEVETGLAGPLDEHLAALVAQASDAHRDFTSAVPPAETRVAAAAGAAVGSDSWAAAQVALADLDSARSIAAIALGDLDILHASASVQAEDATAIDSARDQVIALVREEDAVLERLRGRVR